MGSSRFVGASAGLATILLGTAAHAGGLFVPGIGPSATARAGAWVALADDPTALATNPAGLAKQWGTVLYIGSNFLQYALTVQRSGTYDVAPGETHPWDGQAYASVEDKSKPPVGFGSFQALPAIAVSTDLGLKVKGLRFGAGIFVPTSYPTRSLGADYVFDDPTKAPTPTRYDAVTQEAAIVLPSVGVSYRVLENLDLGGRFTWGIADIKATTYTWGFPGNYEETTTKDSLFGIKVKDNFIPAFGFGALYRLGDSFEFGAQFSSSVNVHGKGTGTAVTSVNLVPPAEVTPTPDGMTNCADGGTKEALKACLNLSLPTTAGAGARYILRDGDGAPKGDVELDVQWEGWKAASDYHVIVDGQVLGALDLNETVIRHGMKDSFSVRAGGSYALMKTAMVRGGIAFDTKAVKSDWERADLDGAQRITFAGGGSYVLNSVKLDLGLGYVFEGKRDVGGTCNPTSANQGCLGNMTQTPIGDRNQPDPIQPLSTEDRQSESPFNSGTYKSHYLFFSLAATVQF